MKRIIFTLAIALFSIIAYSQTTFNISIPNAFTPDGDGLNDKFTANVYGQKSISITIINRLGQVIYNELNGDGWDGTYRNKPCDQNIYVYQVIVTDFDDNKYEYYGTFLLLREK